MNNGGGGPVDTDGDGVEDALDLCPGTPVGQTVDANGCSAAQRDADSDGYDAIQWGGLDCNDSNPAINPGAAEVCDGVDNNCNGQIDEGCSSLYNLLVSLSSNRSGAVPLSGQIVSGNIYVFTGPDTAVKRVSFSLDGVPHSVENYAPFDFEGTGVGNVALPFDTTQLTDDVHQITATIELTNGSTEPPVTANFTVNNGGGGPGDTDGDGVEDALDLCPGTPVGQTVDANGCSAAQRDADSDGYEAIQWGGLDCNDSNPAINPGAAEVCDGVDNNCNGQIDEGCSSLYNLLVSLSSNRSGAVPLSGQIVSGNIYVFTGPDTAVKRVSFSLDGVPHSVENYAPFDFEGTGVGNVALPFDTTQLTDDVHQITATIELTNGSTEPPVTANFTVNNGGGGPGDTDGDGVEDALDLCPGTPVGQTVDANGCSAAQRDVDQDLFEWILEDGTPGPDCNDADPAINPGAAEVCDGVDNNCNGQIDEGCPPVDTDGDGVEDALDLCPGTLAGQAVDTNGCTAAQRDVDQDLFEWILEDGTPGPDCNDSDPAINPGATEVCDGVDNNCDGQIDEGCSSDPQLRAEIGPAKSYVILENSQIYVKYEPFFAGHSQFGIRELRIKSAGNEDQIDQVDTGTGYVDADAGRWELASANIIDDGTAQKTVRLVWNGNNNDPNKPITHEVSIFPHSRYLKIDYVNVQNGINIVDIARPGGTKAGKHVAFGHIDWIRDYITHNYPLYKGSYYNRYPPDGVNDPADGGSLNYNGHFIAGCYNPINGRGIGRTMPVSAISILKLLLEPNQRRGFEFFPYPGGLSHPPFTGYLFVVTGGESEILSVGQQLADMNSP